MDSRIREIEQWVAKAKEDLGECGQEAYIRKLYLLDAEIRAIIRENGILPGAHSPQPQQTRHVRRFTVPVLAVSGVLSVLLLAATTVFLTQPLLFSHNTHPTTATTMVAGFVPSSISGELILADNGDPLNLPQGNVLANLPPDTALTTGLTPPPAGMETGVNTTVAIPPSGVILASAPAQTVPTGSPNTTPTAPALQPAVLPQPRRTGDEVIDVMLVADAGLRQPVPVQPQPWLNTPGVASSVGFDGFIPQVARLEFTDRFAVPGHESAQIVNSVKTQLDPRAGKAASKKDDPQGGHVDKATNVTVDSVDNSANDEDQAEPAKRANGTK
jgi:hypothetical protein